MVALHTHTNNAAASVSCISSSLPISSISSSSSIFPFLLRHRVLPVFLLRLLFASVPFFLRLFFLSFNLFLCLFHRIFLLKFHHRKREERARGEEERGEEREVRRERGWSPFPAA